ncbi:MAG: hypothetical protein M8354_07750 [Halalkalicoccus sp.]|nr:hypothetical protein [Halalkalicoccus sp.]
MRTSVAVVFGLCLVAAIGGLALGAEPAAGQSTGIASDVDNTSQTIEIRLDEDGDANVSVYKQFPLETEEDRAAFERLAGEFEDGEAGGALSVDVFERLASGAENETGREMAIENVEREAESTSSTGTLRLSFTWSGFADASDGTLEVGNVFTIDGETWLPSLSADQRLVIQAPEDYAVENADPPATIEDGTIVWEGPQQFDPGQPTTTLVPSNRTGEGFSLLTVGLGLGLVGAIVLLVYLLSRRRDDTPLVPTAIGGDRGWATILTPASDRSSSEPPAVSPDPDPTDSEDEPDPFAGVDEDLLSDEERVLRLLGANDGRMKQATIVVETDWSNAKVSQLLSSMEEDGEIEKLRIGRENLITLAEE